MTGLRLRSVLRLYSRGSLRRKGNDGLGKTAETVETVCVCVCVVYVNLGSLVTDSVCLAAFRKQTVNLGFVGRPFANKLNANQTKLNSAN